MLMTQSDHTAGLPVTLCAERSLLAVMWTPQQQAQFQPVPHDTTEHNLARTRQRIMFMVFLINFQLFIAGPVLVPVSDKSC